MQRDKARLLGEQGQYVAEIARARGKISETELQILQLDQDFRTEVLKDLRETEGKVAELKERVTAAEDQLKRVDIRAPQDGFVNQLSVHTVGGVITNGETVMQIVPRSDALVVEAKVAPQDIDQVTIGAKGIVRIMAGDQRTMPDLNGVLTRVSADLTRDPGTGPQENQPYYLRSASRCRRTRRSGSATSSSFPACRPRFSSRPTRARRCNICSSRCANRSPEPSASADPRRLRRPYPGALRGRRGLCSISTNCRAAARRLGQTVICGDGRDIQLLFVTRIERRPAIARPVFTTPARRAWPGR